VRTFASLCNFLLIFVISGNILSFLQIPPKPAKKACEHPFRDIFYHWQPR